MPQTCMCRYISLSPNMQIEIPALLFELITNEQSLFFSGVTVIPLPVGIEDPVERLRVIKNNLLATMKDPMPLVGFKLSGFLGHLFHWMVRPIARNTLTTLNSSSLPGPKQEMKLGGWTCTDMCYLIGTIPGNAGR